MYCVRDHSKLCAVQTQPVCTSRSGDQECLQQYIGQVLLTAPTLFSAASRKTKGFTPQDIDISPSILPPEEALKTNFCSLKGRSQLAEMNTGTSLDSVEADHYLVGLCEDPVLVTEPGLELLFA